MGSLDEAEAAKLVDWRAVVKDAWSVLGEEQRTAIRRFDSCDKFSTAQHLFGLGTWLRSCYQIWFNKLLQNSYAREPGQSWKMDDGSEVCHVHADAASSLILDKLWKKAQLLHK